MPQYNMHSELNAFYEGHVRLKGEIDRLRGLRDTNLIRLTEGLKELGHPNFVKSLLQGSIAMHTANQSPDNDYDIDIAVIFEERDLPASPLEARKRVADAINRKATGFSQDPEARTNAVTIWYAEGYHVDIAIYRRREDLMGIEILEHAGANWTQRDPKAITDWFSRIVNQRSPAKSFLQTPQVAPQQMRRIVRWIKAFSKGREGWNLPGGLITSALVAECYQPNPDRDDIALYNTLKQIKSRLEMDCSVYNPVDSSQKLTDKSKFETQVNKLKQRLPTVLKKLEVLYEDSCTAIKARDAWNYMFQHTFWEQSAAKASQQNTNRHGYDLQLTLGLARSRGGSIKSKNVRSGRFLPKRVHLKFEANTNIPPPYSVKWRVINSGDEAEAANDMGHVSASDCMTHWEQTAFRGRHEMICEIIKSGDVWATTRHVVNIR